MERQQTLSEKLDENPLEVASCCRGCLAGVDEVCDDEKDADPTNSIKRGTVGFDNHVT